MGFVKHIYYPTTFIEIVCIILFCMHSNQSQIMALLRGLAIELIRKTSPKKLEAAIEKFADFVATLDSMLKQVKFLWESRDISLIISYSTSIEDQ